MSPDPRVDVAALDASLLTPATRIADLLPAAGLERDRIEVRVDRGAGIRVRAYTSSGYIVRVCVSCSPD